jgi:hypothetical protein
MDCGEITFLSRSSMLLQSDVFLIDNIMNELYNNLSSLFLLCAFYFDTLCCSFDTFREVKDSSL